MHPFKANYAVIIYQCIYQFCIDWCGEAIMPIEQTLNISSDDAKHLINKILLALPDKHFYQIETQYLPERLLTIAQAFVLFQSTQNLNDSRYPEEFIQFIHELSTKLLQQSLGR